MYRFHPHTNRASCMIQQASRCGRKVEVTLAHMLHSTFSPASQHDLVTSERRQASAAFFPDACVGVVFVLE